MSFFFYQQLLCASALVVGLGVVQENVRRVADPGAVLKEVQAGQEVALTSSLAWRSRREVHLEVVHSGVAQVDLLAAVPLEVVRQEEGPEVDLITSSE